jgi:heterodisulfide reductase subunit A
LKEGIFTCGIAHSPRSISETIAMAEATAQRALRILTSDRLTAGAIVAEVRHSLPVHTVLGGGMSLKKK